VRSDRKSSALKVVNDFQVDIMGAIIPGFLSLFSIGVVLLYSAHVLFGFHLDFSYLTSFGAIILILILSYVIGMVFYRADINEPDRASIHKKMINHIREVSRDAKNADEVSRDVKNAEKDNEEKGKNNTSAGSSSEDIPEPIKKRMRNKGFDEEKGEIVKMVEDFNACLYKNKNLEEIEYIFIHIKKSFHKRNSKPGISPDEVDSDTTLRETLDLIDILGDCVNHVINESITKYSESIKEPSQPVDSRILIGNLKVFFDEVKHFDYCNNYNEFKYVLNLILGLKEGTVENVDPFNTALTEYEKNVLFESGVSERYYAEYRKELGINPEKEECNEINNKLLLFAAVRRMQNEEGTPHRDAGGFPYINYNNYLIKRNLPHLAEMINWNYREGRTKNQINRYKIKVQLFNQDAYGVLNRNESHIRMASSSWFASRFLQKVNFLLGFLLSLVVVKLVWASGPVDSSICSSAILCNCDLAYLFRVVSVLSLSVIFIIPILLGIPDLWKIKKSGKRVVYTLCTRAAFVMIIVVGSISVYTHVSIDLQFFTMLMCPVLVNMLLQLMIDKIEDFIHYQRLREIYFALYTYRECRNEIKYKEDYFAEMSNQLHQRQSNSSQNPSCVLSITISE
jgi:hypothetical protein